nr:hypothetical protein [Tanacetum cinerariifolium]
MARQEQRKTSTKQVAWLAEFSIYTKFVNDSHALISPTALGTHLPNMRKINAKSENFKELDGKLKGICMQKGGRQPTSMVSPMAKAGGFTFVSDMIHSKGIAVATKCTDSLGLIAVFGTAFILLLCGNRRGG